jgi:hypothetical protein
MSLTTVLISLLFLSLLIFAPDNPNLLVITSHRRTGRRIYAFEEIDKYGWLDEPMLKPVESRSAAISVAMEEHKTTELQGTPRVRSQFV